MNTCQQVPSNIAAKGPGAEQKALGVLNLVEIQIGGNSPFHEFEIEVHRLISQSAGGVSDINSLLLRIAIPLGVQILCQVNDSPC